MEELTCSADPCSDIYLGKWRTEEHNLIAETPLRPSRFAEHQLSGTDTTDDAFELHSLCLLFWTVPIPSGRVVNSATSGAASYGNNNGDGEDYEIFGIPYPE